MNTVSSAGPYYVAAYGPEQGAVLKRNPNYHGSRPHGFDEIDYESGIGSAQNVKEIEAGTSDFAVVTDLPRSQFASLAARYGPGSPAARAGSSGSSSTHCSASVYLALNTSRPLFADADLRKAVNYALDRQGIAQGCGLVPADRPVSPARHPRFSRHAHLPADAGSGAGQAARPRPRGAPSSTPASSPAPARRRSSSSPSLAPIGIDVQIKVLPSFAVDKVAGKRGAPFDMALTIWAVAYADPANILDYLFDGRSIRATANSNLSYFHDPTYDRKLAAAARLAGPRRYAAYQALEADLLRNAAPAAALYNFAESEFFSARIGCQVYQPIYQIDLAALCLKSR